MGWEYVLVLLVAAVVSIALAPKPPAPTPPSLEDIEVPSTEEGTPVPVVFGEVWIRSPHVLWYGDLSAEPIQKKGGKK